MNSPFMQHLSLVTKKFCARMQAGIWLDARNGITQQRHCQGFAPCSLLVFPPVPVRTDPKEPAFMQDFNMLSPFGQSKSEAKAAFPDEFRADVCSNPAKRL